MIRRNTIGILISQRSALRSIILVASLLAFLPAGQAGIASTTPVLELVNGNVSTDGHIKIAWKTAEKTAEVEVQQSDNQNFEDAKTIYHGNDKATFVSGLENGTYYYRIRRVEGTWSYPVELTVTHHSLRLAFVLFSLGAIVFALTVLVVVKGAYSASDK